MDRYEPTGNRKDSFWRTWKGARASAVCAGASASAERYKRLHRYEETGIEGVGDRSRAPHTHPNQVAEEVEEKVVAARRTSYLGAEEAGGVAEGKGAWDKVASGQHGGEHPGTARVDPAAAEGTADAALE